MDKVRAELIDGTFDVSLQNKTNATLHSFITEFLDIRKHFKSAWREKIIAAHVLSYFGKTIRLDLIKTKDVENFRMHRKSQGISNGTINRELGCLKRMFNLAIKWGDARNNPVMNVDFFKIPQSPGTCLTLEEASKLIVACEDYFRPIVILALNTGMRRSELLSLTPKKINIEMRYLQISDTKGHESRRVILNDPALECISSLVDKGTDFIFYSGRYNTPLRSV